MVTPMASVEKIWTFHTGMAKVHRGLLEASSKNEICWLPILCYLLIHPNGPVLIDTGLGSNMLKRRRKWWGRALALKFHATFEPSMDCRSRIRQCGIDPEDIRVGILTHLHYDHAGAVLDLPRTRFHVSQRELEFALKQRGIAGLRKGYVGAEYREAWNLRDFEWEHTNKLEPFDVVFDLFGDGAVRVFPTPGHTGGHCSVLVRLADNKEALITGDAAFTVGQIESDTPFGFLPKRFGGSLSKANETLHRLRTFARRRENLIVLTSHDPEQGDDAVLGPSVITDG